MIPSGKWIFIKTIIPVLAVLALLASFFGGTVPLFAASVSLDIYGPAGINVNQTKIYTARLTNGTSSAVSGTIELFNSGRSYDSALGTLTPTSIAVIDQPAGSSLDYTFTYTALSPGFVTLSGKYTPASAGSAANSRTSVNISASPQLSISPTSVTLNVNGFQSFVVTGGLAPYIYIISTNNSGGTIDSTTGTYRAGLTGGVIDTVIVTDANGMTVTAVINVSAVQGKASTSVTAIAARGVYGGVADFSATLISNGTGVSAKTVNFSLGTIEIGSAVTDAGGRVTLTNIPISGYAAGNYSGAIGVNFNGDSSYKTSQSTGDLTVAAKALQIIANNASKAYGQTMTFAGTEFTVSGLLTGDLINRVNLSSEGAAAFAAAGTYSIIANGANGSGLGNYAISYINGTLTVVENPSPTAPQPTAENPVEIPGGNTSETPSNPGGNSTETPSNSGENNVEIPGSDIIEAPASLVVNILGNLTVIPLEYQTGAVFHSGTAPSTSGNVSLYIPHGVVALNSDGSKVESIFVSQIVPNFDAAQIPEGTILLQAYECGPSGATFDPPLILTIHYDKFPAGVNEKKLFIAFWNGTAWTPVESTVDIQSKTVRAALSHFSHWALFGYPAATQNVATTQAIETDGAVPYIGDAPVFRTIAIILIIATIAALFLLGFLVRRSKRNLL